MAIGGTWWAERDDEEFSGRSGKPKIGTNIPSLRLQQANSTSPGLGFFWPGCECLFDLAMGFIFIHEAHFLCIVQCRVEYSRQDTNVTGQGVTPGNNIPSYDIFISLSLPLFPSLSLPPSCLSIYLSI